MSRRWASAMALKTSDVVAARGTRANYIFPLRHMSTSVLGSDPGDGATQLLESDRHRGLTPTGVTFPPTRRNLHDTSDSRPVVAARALERTRVRAGGPDGIVAPAAAQPGW